MFDKELMRQLRTIPTENVNDMVQKYGVARVMRVLAATIKCNPEDYDAKAVAMAHWIPPIRLGRNFEIRFCSTIHRIYVQDLFYKYAELRKA